MTTHRRLVRCLTVVATLALLGGLPVNASAVGVTQATLPAAVPTATTPQVLDNAVQELNQAGTGSAARILAAGNFTQVQDASANGGTTFNQPYVFAFNPTSGAVDRNFRPTLNGVVDAVLSGPNNTVYLGGSFTTVNGTAVSRLAQINLSNGQLTSFRPPAINGAVNDILIANGPGGGRLLVAGVFTNVGGVAHGGLASLNPTSGALDPYIGIDVAGHFNWDGTTNTAQGSVGVENFDLSPNGSRLAVIGNFRTADGLGRLQAFTATLTTAGATVDPDWATDTFSPGCYTFAFDSYVRDVQWAPDGSYFAIAVAGGSNPGTHCDTVTRWESGTRGANVQPTWTAYSGGDSSWSVAVSSTAVYAGGHSRWFNNPNGNDSAGAGAVPRPGMAAFDPRTGMPLKWNPGRNPRGVGAQAMLVTSQGLYVGSDTEFIGNRTYTRKRLAYFSLAGGAAPASETRRSLPGNVDMAGRPAASGSAAVDDVVARYLNGTTPSADVEPSAGGVAWGQARGGFMIGNTVYYGYPNANAGNAYYLYKRTFDGATWGPATVLDPYNDPYWSNVSAGVDRWSQQIRYYRGVVPDFYGTPLSTVTGMFFSDGSIYYTKAGSAVLFTRPFSVDSDVLGAQEATAAASGFGDVGGMFLSGNTLYRASAATGQLTSMPFSNGAPGTTVTTVDTTRDWRSRVMFVGPGGAPAGGPTAAFSSTCTLLSCGFDATGSTDSAGTITGYSWNFGDGTAAGTGATPTHAFGSGGTYTVTLTVTDGNGATSTASHLVTVSSTQQTSSIAFRAATGAAAKGATSAKVTVPASVQAGDGMVLVSSISSNSVTVTAPAGWTLEGIQTSSNLVTRIYSRVAAAGDAGSTVTVTQSAAAKVTLQLSAYSGTSAADPVSVANGAVQTGGTSHVTPTASAAAGNWLLSVWSDKSASARTWTAPGSVTVRNTLAGTGSGDVAGLLADGGAAVGGGQVGGLTGTVSAASTQAAMFTVVLTG
jgi:PKD repeat protein